VTVIGWSDGAITGLQLAITAKEQVNKLFAFGANASVSGLRKGGSASRVFSEYMARCRDEYETLSPHPDRWHVLVDELRSMWRSSPNFTARELGRIIAPTTISDGMYDEVIRSGHSKEIADKIPGAKFVLQQEVSHFAMLQDPPAVQSSGVGVPRVLRNRRFVPSTQATPGLRLTTINTREPARRADVPGPPKATAGRRDSIGAGAFAEPSAGWR
jgi:pimeloyl-ACP methyl ester carboxylesterase